MARGRGLVGMWDGGLLSASRSTRYDDVVLFSANGKLVCRLTVLTICCQEDCVLMDRSLRNNTYSLHPFYVDIS